MKQRLLLLLLLAGVSGCTSAMTSQELNVSPEARESIQQYEKEYVLAPGDQLEVWIRRDPEISRTCVVRADGYISLPTIDDVMAAGLTPSQLDSVLSRELSKRLNEPEVKVILTTPRPPMVYVAGEIARPGPVPLRDATSAARAVILAGGFLRSASKNNVVVIRLTPEGRLRASKANAKIGSQAGTYMALQGMPLEADDLVFVPESGRAQFGRFVDDFINKPISGVMSVLAPYIQFLLIKKALE